MCSLHLRRRRIRRLARVVSEKDPLLFFLSFLWSNMSGDLDPLAYYYLERKSNLGWWMCANCSARLYPYVHVHTICALRRTRIFRRISSFSAFHLGSHMYVRGTCMCGWMVTEEKREEDMAGKSIHSFVRTEHNNLFSSSSSSFLSFSSPGEYYNKEKRQWGSKRDSSLRLAGCWHQHPLIITKEKRKTDAWAKITIVVCPFLDPPPSLPRWHCLYNEFRCGNLIRLHGWAFVTTWREEKKPRNLRISVGCCMCRHHIIIECFGQETTNRISQCIRAEWEKEKRGVSSRRRPAVIISRG